MPGSTEVEKSNDGYEGLPSPTADVVTDPILHGRQFPQLTAKGIFVGVLVGIFNAFLAMYYGLRTGITPSLNVLAGLGGFMLMQLLLRFKLVSGQFTVQENAVIQTCAVATYSLASGAGFASGLLALTREVYVKIQPMKGNYESDIVELNWINSFAWCAAVAFFGFFIAFPLRNNMILEQKLLFPSGTATATIIRTLHTSKQVAQEQWSILLKSGTISYCWLFLLYWFEGIREFPIFGRAARKYGWELEFGPGVGAMGLMLPFNIMLSIFYGAIISFGLITPLLATYRQGEDESDWFSSNGMDGLKAYYTFTGIAVVLVDSVYSLLKISLSIAKSVKNRGKVDEKNDDNDEEKDPVKAKEETMLKEIFLETNVPQYFWIGGLLVFGSLSIIIVASLYPIEWYKLLVACILTPVFSIGIIQGVGLTDWNVASALGKLVMFIFGAWSSGSIIPPLLLCQYTIIGCGQAADLMQDFKTGYLVGASPRAMYIAQFIGAFMSILIVPSVWVMMNSAYDIPGTMITAPFGAVYRSLAILAVEGLSALPKNCSYFMLAAAIIALVVLLTIEVLDKKKWAKYIPNPMAVAIGMIIPAVFSLEGLIVASIGLIYARRNEKEFEDKRYILASGMMVGEGIFVLTEILFTVLGVNPPVHISF